MKIPISKIREALVDALTKRHVSQDIAAIVASDYLEGELQGKPSHGLMAFPALLEKTASFQGKQYKVLQEKESLLVVDADGISGSYVGRVVADKLIEKAKTKGIAVGFITNMTTWLRPGAIAQYVVDQDMVAFVVNNGGKAMVAPSGGYSPLIGTNPIGIGIPTAKQPVVVDMATSKHAWGEVRKAKKNNTDVPKESYYSKDGAFAVKADDAYSAVPAGDYKGFSLGMFIEIMTGSFLVREMGPQVGEVLKSVENSAAQSVTRGAMIIVFNPSTATTLDTFKNANSKLIDQIKHSQKLPGVNEIHIPGENASQTKKKNLQNGYLDVDEALWNQLTT